MKCFGALVTVGALSLVLGPAPLVALDPKLDVSQYAHTSWKISEGVSGGVIHEFAQSKDGYIWLATEAGLRRFDGVNAVLWQPPEVQRLPSNDIRGLLAGSDGTLWLGTAKGLASWKSGKLTRYPQLDGFDVNTLREDHEGTIWVAAVKWERAFSEPGRLCAIKVGSVECLGADRSFGFGVSAIHEDRTGNLWLGAANGIWRWKPGPPRRYPLRPDVPPPLLFDRDTMIDRDGGGLIIGAFGEIMQFVDGRTEPIRYQPHRLNSATPICCETAKEACGSHLPMPDLCMCIREGWTSLRKTMGSRAIPWRGCSRIAKAVSGSQPALASTGFASTRFRL